MNVRGLLFIIALLSVPVGTYFIANNSRHSGLRRLAFFVSFLLLGFISLDYTFVFVIPRIDLRGAPVRQALFTNLFSAALATLAWYFTYRFLRLTFRRNRRVEPPQAS